MRRTALIWLGGIALAAGCGGTQAELPAAHPGELHVRQEHAGGGFYVEGSYSYVRLERPAGSQVETRLSLDRVPHATLSLEPGSYRLVSFQRPCDGNCRRLDTPTDRCSVPIEVGEGAELHEVIELTPGSGCTIHEEPTTGY